MKVGDLVRWKAMVGRQRPDTVGLVKRVFQHKLWNASERGKKVDWSKAPKESFAEVLFDGQILRLPIRDLEVIHADD